MNSILLFLETIKLHSTLQTTPPKLDRDRMVGKRGKYLAAPNLWQEKFCETAEIRQCVRKNL